MQEEVRKDPVGWSSLDLHKLLDLWDFTSDDPITTKEGWDVPFRYHPEHPDLNVVIFPEDEIGFPTALHVVAIIDTLQQRQSAP